MTLFRKGDVSSVFPLSFALLIVTAGLSVFSQTWAWYGDEGFHLLAAQLINSGKKPYLDFIYPQPPLYAYLNAAWMQLFGQSWRSAHILSAFLTGGCVILTASFVFERVPEQGWKLSAALTAALLIGLNSVVIAFGTIGQPYGLCLFLIVASFRLITKAVAESRAALILWSGLCAGASAGSSLLSAPVLPILLAWAAWRRGRGRRLKTCVWFLVGAGISSLPLVWLVVTAPRQTFFNTFEYHFFHRSPNILISLYANLGNLTELLNSGQFVLLVVFAVVGLLFVLGRSQWGDERKAEFYLCGWLTAGLGAYLAIAPITFPQYFILLIPFLSILAAVGIMAIASWLRPAGRPNWLVAGVLVLFSAGLPWWILQQRRHLTWPQLEEVAKAVNRVTPKDGLVWADEIIYFAAQRTPPSGLENFDSHKLRLSPGDSAKLHVVPRADLYEWAALGRFASIASCWATDDWIDATGIRKVYADRTTVHGCDIFWSNASTKSNASH
jgi:4-amino-4-deoxy-L-arabinose transferase-like glycosyltransferase